MKKKYIIKIIKVIFIIFMLTFLVLEAQKEIQSIDFAKTIQIMRNLSSTSLILFFLFGMICISFMTMYDFIIVKHLKLKIKPLMILNVSFVANTINNITGFGGLSGSSIRTVFFKKSATDSKDIVNYKLLLLPATGIGLSIMTVISIIRFKYIAPIIEQNKWLLILLLGFLAYNALYFFIDKIYSWYTKNNFRESSSKNLTVRLKLLLVSFIEWMIAYIFFAFICRKFNVNGDIYSILGIFTIASIVGVASMLPAGLGFFDLVILLGFHYNGVTTENTLAALLIFRFFYYFVPLTIGIISTLILHVQNGENKLRFIEKHKIKDFINQTSSITNLLLSVLVFLSGLILLVSALIPGIADRIKIAVNLFSYPILQLSHQISICIGIILIIISFEIRMKVKRAHTVTLYLLLLGSIATFLKGFDYEEAIFVGSVLILLYLSKESFYRKSLPFNWMGTLKNFIFAFVGIIIYVRLNQVIVLDFLYKYNFPSIFRDGTIHAYYIGFIVYVFLFILLLIWQLTKPRIKDDKRYEMVDEIQFKQFLEEYDGHYLTHLIYLEDKHIFWAVDNQIAIIYEKSHNLMIVLGDPIGNPKYFSEGITQFQRFIDEYGYKAAFYQVSESFLPVYHDHGFDFFKLGETALVDLEDFCMNSSKQRDFRNVISRFTRDGYVFELYKAYPNDLLDELRLISDEWLEGRKEMGFSLGWFDNKYISRAPLAIIKKTESNEIIAFASIMPSYDKKKSVSIDLMRFKKDVPNNTMTFLILNLLISYKESGYKIFNLGMAPLSNVGTNQNSHLREKIANFFTRYGKHFYSFKGLRSYKDKFDPKWEARYLAYEDISQLPSSLIEATFLIHSSKDEDEKDDLSTL